MPEEAFSYTRPYMIWISFAFSFLFFALSLGLLPVNENFAMFMIPKTFAYMTAFVCLIRNVIRPVPAACGPYGEVTA